MPFWVGGYHFLCPPWPWLSKWPFQKLPEELTYSLASSPFSRTQLSDFPHLFGVIMRTPTSFAFWISAISLTLAGCGPEQKKQGEKPGAGGKAPKPKVAFVSNNPAEFWTICEAGARKAAEEEDVDLQFKRPQDGTAATQIQIIEDLLVNKTQAISVSVISPDNQIGFLDGVAARIPLLCVDNDASKSKRRAYLGTANIKAGRSVGELIKKALPNGGKIALFVGQLDPVNARERRQGVLDVLEGVESKGLRESPDGKKYGAYQLLGTFTDNVDKNKAKDNAADVLTKNQGAMDLGLVGLWAYNAPAILSAVTDANRVGKVKIVGFDEDNETLEGIKTGAIEGTIVQNPYEFGFQSVKMMADLIRKPESVKIPADGIMDIPHKVLTKDNVQAFQTELKKLLGK